MNPGVHHELRVEVKPPWPFRLRGGSADGLLCRRGSSVQRLLHRDGKPVHVAVVQPARDHVIFGARAGSEPDAMWGIRRLRFATGVDDDLRPFYEAFKDDRVIGKAVRATPEFRVRRAPMPWEALSNAVTEQLIEFERAVAIQRRMIARLGTRCGATGLRDAPTPAKVAGTAPALLASMDLAPARALTLRAVAAELASGRVDLNAEDPMPGWRRLRAIPGVGPWTLEVLALYGQGHHGRLPAGDLGYLKLVGRVTTGNPQARVDEPAVRAFFEPYGEWKGLAGEYLRLAASRGLLPLNPATAARGRAPRRPGTRSSAPARRPAAA
jgi:3-methyladenine DNA glycosylase/8-oxoguanine DNA glycosylase